MGDITDESKLDALIEQEAAEAGIPAHAAKMFLGAAAAFFGGKEPIEIREGEAVLRVSRADGLKLLGRGLTAWGNHLKAKLATSGDPPKSAAKGPDASGTPQG